VFLKIGETVLNCDHVTHLYLDAENLGNMPLTGKTVVVNLVSGRPLLFPASEVPGLALRWFFTESNRSLHDEMGVGHLPFVLDVVALYRRQPQL
jgi:hypothetical protein